MQTTTWQTIYTEQTYFIYKIFVASINVLCCILGNNFCLLLGFSLMIPIIQIQLNTD